MRSTIWLALLTLAPVAVMASDDNCKFRADRAGGIEAKGVEKVVIRAGAGDLKVVGRSNATRIEARGVACAGKQEMLDAAQISVRREGNVVYVETSLPQNDEGWSWGKNDYATIDLGVALPSGLPVDAIDSSGDATLEDLRSLVMQDSSGDLTLTRIAGPIELRAEIRRHLEMPRVPGGVDVVLDQTEIAADDDGAGRRQVQFLHDERRHERQRHGLRGRLRRLIGVGRPQRQRHEAEQTSIFDGRAAHHRSRHQQACREIVDLPLHGQLAARRGQHLMVTAAWRSGRQLARRDCERWMVDDQRQIDRCRCCLPAHGPGGGRTDHDRGGHL